MRRFLITVTAAALSLGTVACSSSGSGDTGGGTAPAGPSDAAEVQAIKYDGPEATLPKTYGTVTPKPGTRCVIGYQNLSAAQQSLSAEAAGAKDEARKLGCSIKVLDDQLTPTKQVNNFNQFLAQKVSAIVLYPLVPESMQPNIDKAVAAGIPVIAIQTPISADQPSPKGYATSVLQGFDIAAYERAKAVALKHPGADFVVQGLAIPVAALQYFAKRERYWGEKFGLHFLGQVDNQDDTPGAATTSTSAAIAKYPSMDALFTFNDDSAAADATALRTAGKKGVLIAGFNGQLVGFKGIKDGGIFCTYQPNYRQVGKLTVDAAYQLAAGSTAKLARITVAPGVLVDKSNVGSVSPLST
jgi:ribose transport system substrate-binding protein